MIKSYGSLDPHGGAEQLGTILEDAAKMSRERAESIFIGVDENNNITVTAERDLFVFAGAVGPDGVFYDNVGYKEYTMDEMMSRVHRCVEHGIIEYGELGFLSEGLAQLSYALSDAKRMVKIHGKHFILGGVKNVGIMLAPQSEASGFVAPLACVVARCGCWSLSDIHSCNLQSDFMGWQRPSTMLYFALGWKRKSYGRFTATRGECAIKLESALEDAAKMSTYFKRKHDVGLDEDGAIFVQPKTGPGVQEAVASVEVHPGMLHDGAVPSRDRIVSAARDTYDLFLRHSSEKPGGTS